MEEDDVPSPLLLSRKEKNQIAKGISQIIKVKQLTNNNIKIWLENQVQNNNTKKRSRKPPQKNLRPLFLVSNWLKKKIQNMCGSTHTHRPYVICILLDGCRPEWKCCFLIRWSEKRALKRLTHAQNDRYMWKFRVDGRTDTCSYSFFPHLSLSQTQKVFLFFSFGDMNSSSLSEVRLYIRPLLFLL